MKWEEEMEEIEKEIESKGRENVELEEGRGGRKRDRLGDVVVKVRWNGVQKGEETLRGNVEGSEDQ